MKITIEKILSWRPCGAYDTRDKIIAKTGVSWPKIPLEIAALDIPIEHKLWTLLRPEIIPPERMHLLACDFAEEDLPAFERDYPGETVPRRAIETKRLWVAGCATYNELLDAQSDALNVARYSDWSAGAFAAWAASWDDPRSAAGTAASNTAGCDTAVWERHLARVVNVLKELER